MDWLVVGTGGNCERKVMRLAEDRCGLETYLPMFIDGRGREQILFRSYIFIEKCIHQYRRMKLLPGVLRVVGELSAKELQSLRARENGGVIKLPSGGERFNFGDKVEIPSGPFQWHRGIYQGMSKGRREKVLLTLLAGREFVAEFPFGKLLAA